jgi:hypothetical protein
MIQKCWRSKMAAREAAKRRAEKEWAVEDKQRRKVGRSYDISTQAGARKHYVRTL